MIDMSKIPQPVIDINGAHSLRGKYTTLNWKISNFVDTDELDDDDLFQLCLVKWHTLYSHTLDIRVNDGGHTTCALCLVHFSTVECGLCPVATFTGKDACRGTPYQLYANTRNDPKAQKWYAYLEWKFLGYLASKDYKKARKILRYVTIELDREAFLEEEIE